MKGRSRWAVALLVGAFSLIPLAHAGGEADRQSVTGDRGSDMAVDLVVLRPLGLVATVIGAAGWVIALPFTLPSGSAGEAAHHFVGRPFEYTFSRPLGDFDHCGAERRPCSSP